MEKKSTKLKDLAVLNLKALLIILIVAIIFIITKIGQDFKILSILGTILRLLRPLLFGFIIAWLFDPLVTYLRKKGIKRFFGTLFAYFVLMFIIIFTLSYFLPALYDQLHDFAVMMPSVFRNIRLQLSEFIHSFANRFNMEPELLESQTYANIGEKLSTITTLGPDYIFNFIKSFLKFGVQTIISLIIGFYLLIDFDRVKKYIKKLIPSTKVNLRKTVIEVQRTLRTYVKSIFIVVVVLCIFQTLAFSLSGLPSPLAFGLFCALTNMIPYVGPYIGGIPAVIVGFTISPNVGLATLLSVLICQFIESYFLTPNIMSKKMKLHPVFIIIGLSVFGSLFGIIGMIISTPILACIKVIYTHLDFKALFKKKGVENEVNLNSREK